MNAELKVGGKAMVIRPDMEFTGKVLDLHAGYARIAGKGEGGSHFDEWFPLNARKITVKPCSSHFNK